MYKILAIVKGSRAHPGSSAERPAQHNAAPAFAANDVLSGRLDYKRSAQQRLGLPDDVRRTQAELLQQRGGGAGVSEFVVHADAQIGRASCRERV